MTKAQYGAAQKKAAEMMLAAGIRLSEKETANIEVVDFGLDNLEIEGAQILTLVQTERISVKIIALFPCQTEPEHWHPPVGNDPGKEETIRVVDGILYLYIPSPDGGPGPSPGGGPSAGAGNEPQFPENKDKEYTGRKELVMKVNDQATLTPGTKHWFRAGNEGAVIYSYSTIARDVSDLFTDPKVIRISKIEDQQ